MSDNWCVILGASSGMGKACASALSANGFNIVGLHMDPSENQPMVDEIITIIERNNVQSRFFNQNAANETNRKRVLAELKEIIPQGGVKVLIHSLAFGTLLPFIRLRREDEVIARRQMDMTFSVMAHSLVYWTQGVVHAQLMQKGGKIFAMTSAGSSRISKSYGAVSAAKCAIESHVRQLAVELAPLGIAVNAIRAGVTLTPSFIKIPESEALEKRTRALNPHGRLTTPQDVADAIMHLSKVPSSWMTGNVIGVDGGEILTS